MDSGSHVVVVYYEVVALCRHRRKDATPAAM
jgi:hypothetical protein